MAIEYFNAYHSYLKSIEPLNDAERGRLFTALLEYSSTGATPDLRGNERFIFPTMKEQIDRDVQKYEVRCKKNRENILQRYTTVDDGIRPPTKSTKEKAKEKEKTKAKENTPPLSPSPGETPAFSPVLQEAVDSWLRYKHEKRQDYQPEGLRNLFGQIRNNAAKYGDAAVAEVIRQSMSSNYQGIVFDRLTRGRAATGFESGNPFFEMLEEERGHG